MASISSSLEQLQKEIPEGVTLVAISKYHPNEAIEEAYKAGQRVFGESKAQELVPKYEALPKDIEWHFIGHLQRNKVKYIAPFVHLIHSVDSPRLLKEINKQAKKSERIIPVLLQVHIADEEQKFGFDKEELTEFLSGEEFQQMKHIRVQGLMGMATNTDDEGQIRKEFTVLKSLFDTLRQEFPHLELQTLSMGMSGDYALAIECGSTMVRIGSKIFGNREY